MTARPRPTSKPPTSPQPRRHAGPCTATAKASRNQRLRSKSQLARGSGVGFDAAPVTVLIDRVLATDVLVVPVGALLASTGQGFSVERLTADGIELVPVEPGQFAAGLVEVSGAISEGDEVVVPS